VIVLVAAGAVVSVGPWRAAPVVALAVAALCALPGPASPTRAGLAGLTALTVAYEGCDLAALLVAVAGALYVVRAGTVRSRAAREQRAAVEGVAGTRRVPSGGARLRLAPLDALAGLALLTAGGLTATRPHGWWLTVCAAAVCGFALVDRWTGYARERRAPAPAPVLRALATQDEDDRLWIFAADDTAARRPLFRCAAPAGALAGAAYGSGAAYERPAAPAGRDDDGAEDAAALGGRPGPREVLLVGAPVAGERLRVVPGAPADGPGFRTGRVRLPRPERAAGRPGGEPVPVPRASTLPNDGVPV
jgi:hypothetical protein